MPDLNPIHYILAGVIVLLLGVSGYAWVVKQELNVSEAQFAALKAGTEAVANAQKVKNLEELAKRDAITNKLTEDNVKLQSDLTRKYADYKRVLHSPGSGAVPSLSTTAETVIATEEPRLSGAMGQLEEGILELAKSRDEAITQSNMCADWIEEQIIVK